LSGRSCARLAPEAIDFQFVTTSLHGGNTNRLVVVCGSNSGRAAARAHTQVRPDSDGMHQEGAISAAIDFSSDTHPLARYDFVDFEPRDERLALPISNTLVFRFNKIFTYLLVDGNLVKNQNGHNLKAT
jgi:hypothetical protein